jgi:hypothetical protein
MNVVGDGDTEKMTDSLILEYNIMKKRYKKLVLEGKQLQKEHAQDVEYFIKNNISDKKWQNNLEKTACNLGQSQVRIKIAKNKMNQIKDILLK